MAPTRADLDRFVRGWFFRLRPLGVNGAVKRRWYVRGHKIWEYSKGLALTKASRPTRAPGAKFHVLDVGGAMTLPVFYLASLGDHVVCLDISEPMTRQMNALAKRAGLNVDGRTTNLVTETPSAESLGAPGGFDRVYSFCVIEHILPPGQQRVAQQMSRLLKPGGLLCLTFDYGEHAPTEAPMYSMEHVRTIREAIGLELVGESEFVDLGTRHPLNRKYPDKPYTFGMMIFRKPA